MMSISITEQLTYRIVNEVLHEQFLREDPGDGGGGAGDIPDAHPSGGGWHKHPDGFWQWIDENGNPVTNPARIPEDAPKPPGPGPIGRPNRGKYRNPNSPPAGLGGGGNPARPGSRDARPGAHPDRPAPPPGQHIKNRNVWQDWRPPGTTDNPGMGGGRRPSGRGLSIPSVLFGVATGLGLGLYGGSRGDQPPDGGGDVEVLAPFTRPPLYYGPR
jgi:hypothetical protein